MLQCIEMQGSSITFISLGQMAGVLNSKGELVHFQLCPYCLPCLLIACPYYLPGDTSAALASSSPCRVDTTYAGDMPRANIAFLADGIGSTMGGLLGSSALTTCGYKQTISTCSCYNALQAQ